MAATIDGKAMAALIVEDTAHQVAAFLGRTGIQPTLAVILVGDDPASQVYVRRKLAASGKAGIRSVQHNIPADTSEAKLLDLVDTLNADRTIHGILIQLPLPRPINPAVVLDRINPLKDVDGFHPVNVGRLSIGTSGLVPCTPLGCMMLIDSVVPDIAGKKVVVIGKSNIVGKPVALLLLEREATVTVTHIRTVNLPDITRTADILVVAAGVPGLVRGDWVKPGAVVIDVGINRVDDDHGGTRIVGDCAFAELHHAAAITPVPGGVGPMTVACLMANTIRAARNQLCAN
jgi:methylenetetrahydrofolate dehydrogenase (NADP+)/methenyltetrahydrofolate cyclohydrolase